MAEFFGSKLLRWLTVPYRSRVMTFAAKPFTQVADRILGSQFLGDIAEFFTLLQTMEKGFVKRAGEVDRLLADRRTTFIVVSTLEAAPVRESEFFIRALAERHLPLGALVLNKVLPAWLVDREAEAAADMVAARADALAKGPRLRKARWPVWGTRRRLRGACRKRRRHSTTLPSSPSGRRSCGPSSGRPPTCW